MSATPQEEIYKRSLLLVSILGETMHNKTKKLYLFRLINCLVIAYLLIIVFANFFHAEKEAYIQLAESNIVIIHTFLKYVSFIYFKYSVKKLLYVEQNLFWKYQNFNQNIVNTYDNFYDKLKAVQFAIIFGGYVCLLFFLLRPLFTHNTVFPFEFWASKDSIILDATVLILEHYMWFVVFCAIFGYDIFYLSFSISVVLQVKLLKYKLLYLPDNNTEELRKCIKHHQILVWILHQLKSIYSVTLLFHYFVTLFASCVEMYKLILVEGNISYFIAQCFYMCMIFSQFAFYAYPAELIAFEYSDISNTIYMSKWYDNSVNIQKLLLTIMMDSQKADNLSAGGIIDINMATLGTVIQKSVSFYAILRNILNK